MLTFHTVLLLIALFGLAGLVGWTMLGPLGAAVVIAVSLLTSTAAYRGRARASLRQMGGRPLQWYEAPDLYELVAALAHRAGLPTPRLYLLPGEMVNAVAVATASSSAIGVTRPLLRHMPADEVAAVIAHELSHIRHGDLPLNMVAAGLAGAAAVLAEMGRFGVIFAWLLGAPVGVGELALALLVAGGIPAVALALRMSISREREYLADAGAAALVGSTQLMARALWRLDQLNRPTWWQRLLGYPSPVEPTGLAALFSSHPPTRQRIARLQAMRPPRPNLTYGFLHL
ncbi:heat shock protein HtpX [Symbiobacterium terraclitae]|uniref:Heat shock protein HtpX n=1 Tax=Symbiobacterium terraclitae TaxID=557451 RepID=A0ABS4JSQ9_9FIRM|nr:M48 family metalloprotease [Symbiobacterium terraclitae]MBP2018567.1 heat shock protein HtpX [Symbiobacterium terraclitae]